MEDMIISLNTNIGLTTSICQAVEEHTKTILDWSILTQEERNDKFLNKKHDKRTMGKLLKELNTNFDLSTEFYDFYNSIVQRRNDLIHNLMGKAMLSVRDKQKIISTYEFVKNLRKDAFELSTILYNVIEELITPNGQGLTKLEIEQRLKRENVM